MPLNSLKRPQAERDIEEAFVYIAEGNLDAAVTFLVAVEDTIDELTRFPFLGKPRNNRDARLSGLRVWRARGFEKYLLFYSVTADTIDVVRVLHSARDIKRILD